MEDIIDHYSSLLNGKLVGLDRGPERPLWAFYMLGGARPLWRSLLLGRVVHGEPQRNLWGITSKPGIALAYVYRVLRFSVFGSGV